MDINLNKLYQKKKYSKPEVLNLCINTSSGYCSSAGSGDSGCGFYGITADTCSPSGQNAEGCTQSGNTAAGCGADGSSASYQCRNQGSGV